MSGNSLKGTFSLDPRKVTIFQIIFLDCDKVSDYVNLYVTL